METSTTSSIATTLDAGALSRALVNVRLSCHGWGVNRKLDDSEYETAASKDLTAASKKLTTDYRYKAIQQIARATDRWLEDREVGVIREEAKRRRKKGQRSTTKVQNIIRRERRIRGPGVHALPVVLVEDVIDELEKRRTAYFEAVDVFCNAIPEIKAKAALPKADGGLGALYRESDWPAVDYIRARFSFDWDVFEEKPPEQRDGLSSAFIAKIEARAREKWLDAGAIIETGLFTELTGLVGRLTERLGEDAETGKARIFHETTVEKLRDFLSLLPSRNVTGQVDLASVAKRCEALLTGTDAQAIRDSSTLRGTLRDKFTAINSELVETSKLRGARQFNFGQASGF